ncbi:hypothetical protein [Haloarchaeobius sp. TZWWS8]|uniref:hypothetical protein n=1 Tax=Haloarchaeobius sp. TZWWS8 TaxID=3446121 RepID=UPI003EB7539B
MNVLDLGADDTGTDPIDTVIREAAEPGETLVFPPGRYQVEHLGTLDQDGLELRGDDATLVPADRTSPGLFLSLTGRDQTVSGFEYDVSECRVAPAWHVRSDATIREVTVTGDASLGPEYEPAESGERSWALFNVKHVPAGSTARFENIDMRRGVDRDADARRGWFVSECDGRVVLEDVQLERWAENTVYGTYANGTDPDSRAVFRGLSLRNTNVGLRTSGDTLVEDSTFVHDGPVPAQLWSGGRRQRGVWVEGGKSAHPKGTTTIRDCEFRWTDEYPDHAGQPIVLNPPPRRVVLEDIEIDNRHPTWPSVELDPHDGQPVELVLRDVTIRQRNERPAFRLRGDFEVVEARGIEVDCDGPVSNVDVPTLQAGIE